MTRTSLTSLPPELFVCVLDHVPSIDLQRTTSSLLRIFPYGSIPNWRRYLFYHVQLKSVNNVRTLLEHLQRNPGDADYIKKLSIATWTADADAAINVVLMMIPKLEWLSLCIGTEVTLEHSKLLFRKPSPPAITFLDLSTSHIDIADLSNILCNLPRLRHLILDRCGLLEGESTRHWVLLAHRCLIAGQAITAECRVNYTGGTVSVPGSSRPREVRVLPRTLALRTLSLSAPADRDAERLLAAFRRGWREAVTMFNDSISVTRQSRATGDVLTVRHPWPGEEGHVQLEYDSHGMVVVDDDDEFARLSVVKDCPVVCLAGQSGRGEGIEHAESCGHSIGWDIWEDTL